MNIKEYISSGILESYVLGELTGPERAEVEKNLLLFPELKEELVRIEDAQEALLMQTAISPGEQVKRKLFQSIAMSSEERKVVPLPPGRRSGFLAYAAAASISIAVISSYLAFSYWNKWKDVSSELTELIAQNQQIAENYNHVDQQLNKLRSDIQVMEDPSFKRVDMTGTVNAPEALASVYWNKSTAEVYLRIHNLKELSSENQYQLWAIIDGKPVDAGVFDVNRDGGLVRMKNIADGALTFAVTIEARGGKASPTLETMQVAGNVMKG